MLLATYKTLMRLSTPVLNAYLDKRMARGKEDKLRAHERKGAPTKPRPSGALVWCHAASVGESLSLLSVIQKIATDYPNLHIMVTTGTVTSAQLMAQRLPPQAFHQYVPVDHPVWVDGFLNHWQPDFVIWSESEFWPNLLSGIKARQIPAVLLNARMSADTCRKWGYARGFIANILSVFDVALAQNEAEAMRLRTLGARLVKVSSNLKYAAQPLPFDAAVLAQLQQQTAGRKIVLFASTHAGEEDLAVRVHQAVQAKHPDLLTVIVPRHPQRGGEIAALIDTAGLSYQRRSQQDAQNFGIDATTQIYLADTLGELGLFFSLCATVVMGGSFADVGGHNPIEPAQMECLIIYGPQMYNFIGICGEFEQRHAALSVAHETALSSLLDDVLLTPEKYAITRANALRLTAEKSHVIDELMADIAPVLQAALQKKGVA